jgi:tetratricopeptide (TPR) repeat protein
MQPFTADFAKTEVTPQAEPITVGGYRYRAEIGEGKGHVHETGPEGEKRHRMLHAMGGKNVYYFLTPMERGRLQVLPVAYDVRKKNWFDTTASMVRHFTDLRDEPLDWKERPLTFNVSCYNCHVSQLSTNYDAKTDTYRTVWAEPGINCETCHGPGAEHVRVCKEAPEGQAPKDLKIISTKKFTPEQTNDMCAPCHSKAQPFSASFQPGDRYFDHFGLVTLEHRDFYPDGRDLGENYTYTLWLMSPCVKSGQLDCVHCHTSSGRYRFQGEQANDACLPCHEARVKNATAHTHHAADSEGNKCIACHMPMTEFARMRRSDHSMLPPTPSATMAFNSPNACNLCHTDKNAAWADKLVREWHPEDYQAPVLYRAGLIDAARRRDWGRLPEMLAYVTGEKRDEVYTTSLIRLLELCDDERKWPALLKSLQDPSPLVRSAAATALGSNLTQEIRGALFEATEDEYRLVRIRVASALAAYPRSKLKPADRQRLKRASDEYEASLKSRPDDWASHYNLGNYYSSRGESQRALPAYRMSLKLDPNRVLTLVNASMVHARLGQAGKVEELLLKALAIEPENAVANFNLGLLLVERGDPREAENCLRAALRTDPTLAQAAYNLGVLLAGDRIGEAIEWCRKASELRPNEPKYAYTFAFYLHQGGDAGGAIGVLRELIERAPSYPDAYMLLGGIHEEQGNLEEAIDIYRQAAESEMLSEGDRYQFMMRLRALLSR